MVDVITESDMIFIPDNTFHIEDSSLYKSLGEGIKSVEFVRIKDRDLMFVEARKSFPNPENIDAENLTKFHTQIDEISEKFLHSLNLLSSVEVGVANGNYPDDFILPDKLSLVFVFVIKDHETKWCRFIRLKLLENLPTYLKTIWRPEVFVINHQTAVNRKLAVD